MAESLEREILLKVGCFLEVFVESNWRTAYIVQVSADSLRVIATTQHQPPQELTIHPPCGIPVFSTYKLYSRETGSHDFLVHIALLCRFLEPSQYFQALRDLIPAINSSTEHFLQFYLCHLPMIQSYLRVSPHLVLEIFPELVPTLTDFIEKSQYSERQTTTNFIIPLFCNNTILLLQSAFRTETSAVLGMLMKGRYFEAILSRLEVEDCGSEWTFRGAGMLLLHESVFPLLLTPLLQVYQRLTTPQQIEGLWKAASAYNGLIRYPFLDAFESVLVKNPQCHEVLLFSHDFICTLVSNSNLSIQKNGIDGLLRAIQGKKHYALFCLESAKLICHLSLLSMKTDNCESIEKIFASMSTENLFNLLHKIPENPLSLVSPTLLSVIIDRKEWEVLKLLISFGLRLSYLNSKKGVAVVVSKCLKRAIDADLFASLADVPYKPEPHAYLLINIHYSYSEQMKILSALSPSHTSEVSKMDKLPRKSAVINMLKLHTRPVERLKLLWLIDKAHLLVRVPRVLLRYIISEFAL